MPIGIIIFGLNGSGKLTLGRALAKILGYKYMAIEAYHFKDSEIPYTIACSHYDYETRKLYNYSFKGRVFR